MFMFKLIIRHLQLKIAVFWVVALITLMMEAASTSEMLVYFCQTTQCNNPENSHLHTRHCENLKSHIYNYFYVGLKHLEAHDIHGIGACVRPRNR
jgi:hypothetical protein